jgi:hypothetical protein
LIPIFPIFFSTIESFLVIATNRIDQDIRFQYCNVYAKDFITFAINFPDNNNTTSDVDQKGYAVVIGKEFPKAQALELAI